MFIYPVIQNPVMHITNKIGVFLKDCEKSEFCDGCLELCDHKNAKLGKPGIN